MKRKKLSFTTRYVLAFGVLLLVANIALGIVTLKQSESSMSTLIRKNMLDVVNSAAGSLDGDALGALTADDVGGEEFNNIAQKLTVFQKNVDIRFIYAVRQEGEGRYVFTVDPDPIDPGAFGEEIVVTDALISAGRGVATVDDAPMADRWGNFYSAYCPVFDSSGHVAGIVGIDFDADWYTAQIRKHTISIAAITTLTVLIGGVVVFMITNRVRKRFKELDFELSTLSASVDHLMREVGTISGHEVAEDSATGADELERLSRKIHTMQSDMLIYLDFLHTKAYTDALTRVGSTSAYHERIRKLDMAITEGHAEFSIAVFDVNSLKEVNDRLGHERGDEIIRAAAEAISKIFGPDHTYRIGGDEFAAIADEISIGDMACVDLEIEAINAAAGSLGTLSLSKGVAHFRPKVDNSFKEVFSRADVAMYEDKRAYYAAQGKTQRH